jgi:CRISPR-associated endonuclease/helicase Cas3
MEAIKRRAIAERAAAHAREMIGEGRKAVAVMVNRVDTARRVWTLLRNAAFDTVLITGRMRPLDQAAMIARIESRVMAGRAPQTDARPIVVVATQTLEAGADYDFDGLVTECASLDALRQRFGRLDRMGEYAQRALDGAPEAPAGEHQDLSAGSAAGPAPAARAVILMRSDYLGSVVVDPVYGKALPETWTWLVEVSDDDVVDFGIAAIEPYIDAAGDRVEIMIAPSRPPPVLLPAYLDQWAQTNPSPHADPDVSLFLHGIPEDARSALADVRVVWRSDITQEDLATAVQTSAPGKRTEFGEHLIEHLAMVPPGSLEAISLPIWTVKQWLSESDTRQDDDIADVEGVPQTADEQISSGRGALIWRGSKRSEIAGAASIAPGDTIVVPAGYGGIGEHGTFDPAAVPAVDEPLGTRPIYDLGDLVQLRQRGSPSLRLDARVLGPLVGQGRLDALNFDRTDEESEIGPTLRDTLGSLRETAPADAPDWYAELVGAVATRPKFARSPRGVWIALGRGGSGSAAASSATLNAPQPTRPVNPGSDIDPTGSGEQESESFTGGQRQVLLTNHLAGVASLAGNYARRAQLPPGIVTSLEWAARVHDIGKADPRFQLWLHGGDEIAARFGEFLAKSAIPWQSLVALREARKRARYPEGQRHELVSLDMIERSVPLKAQVEADGGDWELVLHLVATHHGWCRPLAPVVDMSPEDGELVPFTVDEVQLEGSTAHERDSVASGVAARFWRLNRRYGRHELAYLEAILRLADHRQSAWEGDQ